MTINPRGCRPSSTEHESNRSKTHDSYTTPAGTIAIVTVNAFTVLTDEARDGRYLSPWQPFVWEYSSALLNWALIPCVAWFNNRFLRGAHTWKWTLPLRLLATIPYSIIHVSGMVALRKLAYHIAGLHYDFGAMLSNWVYEYRKDFLVYWLILTGLYAFRVYRLWLKPTATAGRCHRRRYPAGPSMYPPPIPKPMMRRVNTSITTSTQWLRSRIDSQRKKATLRRLSLACAKKVSQEGPRRLDDRGRNVLRESSGRHPCRSAPRRRARSVRQCVDCRIGGYDASSRGWPR